MASAWPSLSYEAWSATCDTCLACAYPGPRQLFFVELAPPEPQLQHAALRLTPRGWETNVLPAPNGSGTLAAGWISEHMRRSSSTAVEGRPGSP